MQWTKKFWLVLTLAGLLFSGCRSGRERPAVPPATRSQTPSLRVVCSFLPLWAFTKNVVGERPGVEVEVLIPGSQGPHDYQLTPADMKKINAADLFIVNGFALEEFLSAVVKKSRPGLKIVEASQGIKPIRVEETESEGETDEEAHPHHHEGGINPHPFASPREASRMVMTIAEALAAADPAGAELYRKNAVAYAARLSRLADEFKAVVATAPHKKIVTFHNAFDYLARDCGLEIVGVIETVPGQEPSAGELARLVKTIKSAGVAAIFSEPQFSPRLAQVLSQETGIPFAELDPAATGEMRPDYYERVMEKNLATLKKVLQP